MSRTVRFAVALLAASLACPAALVSQVDRPSIEGCVLDSLTA